MTRPVSRVAIIAAIVRKDLREFSRDTLYLFLSLIGLVFFIGIFWLMPNSVDETITLGVHQTGMDRLLAAYRSGDASRGLSLVEFKSAAQLKAVVAGRLEAWRTTSGALVLRDKKAGDARPGHAKKLDVALGIAFPDGFAGSAAAGRAPVVTVYADSAVPPETRTAVRAFVRELAYGLAGDALPVTVPSQRTVVLGQDRAGSQVTMRERMRPMLAIMVLMIEVFSMASLVSSEILTRTASAVLVTPASVGDLLAAKTVYGTLLASSQAIIVLVAVGAFTAHDWPLVLTTVLIGSLLFTGVAMLIGSAGKDFIGTLFYGMLFLVPLMIPAFALLFPGTASPWVRVLPTYGLVQVFSGVITYGRSWGEVAGQLAGVVAWVAAVYATGLLVLRRKVASL